VTQIVAGSTERHSFSRAKGWVVEARLPTPSFHSTLRLANVTRHLLVWLVEEKTILIARISIGYRYESATDDPTLLNLKSLTAKDASLQVPTDPDAAG
jgi:hypothetical protein